MQYQSYQNHLEKVEDYESSTIQNFERIEQSYDSIRPLFSESQQSSQQVMRRY
jgi:glycerol-3-phosphate dehydrogenase